MPVGLAGLCRRSSPSQHRGRRYGEYHSTGTETGETSEVPGVFPMSKRRPSKKTRDTGQIMLEAMLASQQSTELMEMARHFFSLMGGPSGFARELHREYMASKAGGLVRFKILDLVLACQRFITPKDSLREELGLLTEADLQRVHQE